MAPRRTAGGIEPQLTDAEVLPPAVTQALLREKQDATRRDMSRRGALAPRTAIVPAG
ncbi:hypothetical protein [Nocardia sp. NPDC005366]|uniref:hypothetical protein n=1 Tax=Nocardia sp. NPDC005366 TaxID=3156878 RepID=UPI0033B7C5AB